MNFGGLGDSLKKLGVTDGQVKQAGGLLGADAALIGKAESFLGGSSKPAVETAAPAPGAGAAPPSTSELNSAPGPVSAPAAATAAVAAAATAGGDAPETKTANPVAPGAVTDGPKSDAIHKYAAQAGISSSVVDQGLAALGKVPDAQLKAAAAKLGVSASVVDQGLGALGIKKATPPATPTPTVPTPGGAPTAGATPPTTGVPATAGLEETHPVADSTGAADALKAPPAAPSAPVAATSGPTTSGGEPAAKPTTTADSIADKLPGGLGDSAAVKGAIGKGLSMFGK